MSTRPPSSQPDMPPRAPVHPATLLTPPITAVPALHRSVRHAYPACPAPRLVAQARPDNPVLSAAPPIPPSPTTHPDPATSRPRPNRQGYPYPPRVSPARPPIPSRSYTPAPTTLPAPIRQLAQSTHIDYPPQRHLHACPSRLPGTSPTSTLRSDSNPTTRPNDPRAYTPRIAFNPARQPTAIPSKPTTHIAPRTSRHQPDSPTQPASPTAHPRQAISLRSGASPHDSPAQPTSTTARSDKPPRAASYTYRSLIRQAEPNRPVHFPLRLPCPTPPGCIPSLYDQPTHCDPNPSAPTTQLSPRHSLTAPTTQLSTSRDRPATSRLTKPAPTNPYRRHNPSRHTIRHRSTPPVPTT